MDIDKWIDEWKSINGSMNVITIKNIFILNQITIEIKMSLSLFGDNANSTRNTHMVLPTITNDEKSQLKEYSSICLTIKETAKSLAKLRKIKKNKEEMEINVILEKIKMPVKLGDLGVELSLKKQERSNPFNQGFVERKLRGLMDAQSVAVILKEFENRGKKQTTTVGLSILDLSD